MEGDNVTSGAPSHERNFTLAIDYGVWPQATDVEATVGVSDDASPSADLLAGYGHEHPGNTTALDVLVQWAERTGTAVVYEDGAPVARIIDGVGNPIDPQIPPWWCYRLNDVTPDVSAWQNEVVANDIVEFFYGDCGGP